MAAPVVSVNSTVDGWQSLTETAQTAASLTTGGSSARASTNSSEHESGAAGDRASTTFVGNTVPDGTLDTTSQRRFSHAVLDGAFAAGNWTFQFAVSRPTQAGAADGQIVFRLIRRTRGSGATEITSAQQSASACTNVATDVNGTLTSTPAR